MGGVAQLPCLVVPQPGIVPRYWDGKCSLGVHRGEEGERKEGREGDRETKKDRKRLKPAHRANAPWPGRDGDRAWPLLKAL